MEDIQILTKPQQKGCSRAAEASDRWVILHYLPLQSFPSSIQFGHLLFLSQPLSINIQHKKKGRNAVPNHLSLFICQAKEGTMHDSNSCTQTKLSVPINISTDKKKKKVEQTNSLIHASLESSLSQSTPNPYQDQHVQNAYSFISKSNDTKSTLKQNFK